MVYSQAVALASRGSEPQLEVRVSQGDIRVRQYVLPEWGTPSFPEQLDIGAFRSFPRGDAVWPEDGRLDGCAGLRVDEYVLAERSDAEAKVCDSGDGGVVIGCEAANTMEIF